MNDGRTCDGCALAVWKRTASGALHRSREGKCGFVVVFPVLPNSRYYISGPPSACGGFIERGRVYDKPCAHYREPLPGAAGKPTPTPARKDGA